MAVLIVACPLRLGSGHADRVDGRHLPQLGILIKGPEVLESTRRVDTVVLDKTGTVTTGQMALHDVVPADGEDADAPVRLGPGCCSSRAWSGRCRLSRGGRRRRRRRR